MDESDDDWSLHDIDRVPETLGDVPLSPRGYAQSRASMASMSSRRSSAGFLDGSSSSLRHLPEMGGGVGGAGSSGMGGGGGRSRFQRRGWGSTAGAAGVVSAPSTVSDASQNIPSSPNLEAVMSFPPMSDEHIALSNNAAMDSRRSNTTTTSSLWSETRSPSMVRPTSTTSIGQPTLNTNDSFTGQSLTGGSLGRDESISDHVMEGVSAGMDDDNVSLSKAPAMPTLPSYSTTSRSSLKNSTHQPSVTTGLTPHQRARFENLGGAPSRNRLDTGGSSSTRVRLDSRGVEKQHQHHHHHHQADVSESTERPRHLGNGEAGSDSSWVDETDHGGGDEDTEAGDSTTIDTRKVIVLWGGLELPYWLISWLPSLHRISTLVVTRAPCFICWGFRQPTDRTILARLNILVAFLTAIQLASTVFLAVVSWNRPDEHAIHTLSDQEASDQANRGPVLFNVWTTNVYIYFTGMLAFVNFAAAVLTMRVIRNVNLVGAVRYLWVLLWVLPLQFQSNIGLFDYFRVTDVWIKHYWRDSSMSWFRAKFCNPPETADFECAVPLSNSTGEADWCSFYYNATNCSSIRNNAQSDMETWILTFYYLNASVGLALICLLVLTVNVLEHIISKPLVQKSRESNVPAWMSLPIVSCVAFGLIFSFSSSSVLNTRTQSEATWIGPLFLITAGLFFIAANVGWLISARPVMSTRHKRNKLISIWAFIIMMVCILVLLTTIFATCIAFSVSLVEVPISWKQRGDIACFLDESGSCTNCHNETALDQCPEWSIPDVTKVIQTQAKASASLAAMLMLYALSALRFGIGLRTHIRMYQIEYV